MNPFARKKLLLPRSPDFAGMFSLSPPLRLAVQAAGCFVAYVALEWVSFIHEHEGLPITPWNPGLGVVFALMVLAGPWMGLVLFAGVVVAEVFVLQSKLEWPIIIGVATIIAASYAFAAILARGHLRLDVGLVHLRDVLVLLAVGLSGAMIDTALLILFFLGFRQFGMDDVLSASAPLLVGDIIGIAVITPLMLRFVFRRHAIALDRLGALAPEAALYVVAIGATLWAVAASESLHGVRLFYLLFLPVGAAAVRHGLDGACLSLAVTQLGLVGLLQLYGYDAQAFTEFQTLMLILTATGLIVGVVVSEQRNADRLVRAAEARIKEKEADAARAARFNLVSGMASALAHEITQPMTAARALARSAQHILRTPGGDLARADNDLTILIAQIDHAGWVLRRIRDFLRRGQPHVSTVDVPHMIEEALTLVRADAAARRVQIELDVATDLPAIHGDRIQLEQVVLNLVRNAMEAIAGARLADGRIRIVARRLTAPPGVEIGVLDNGPGIREELADHLFEPLTTSKQEGLGLGLPICASIVESLGGRVWLHSRTAGATEFRFSLPLVPAVHTMQRK